MRKSILVFAVLLSVFSLALSSCSSDDDTSSGSDVLKGTYEIYLDGVLYKEGTNAEVGIIKDNQGNYVNTVTIGTGTAIAIVVSGFPTTVGDVANMDSTSTSAGVNIVSGQETYNSRTGTLTRTSASKISFDGTCSDWPNLQTYSITGYVESSAWEIID